MWWGIVQFWSWGREGVGKGHFWLGGMKGRGAAKLWLADWSSGDRGGGVAAFSMHTVEWEHPQSWLLLQH
jgi:hypothetical protein